jgi:hypothetical protein
LSSKAFVGHLVHQIAFSWVELVLFAVLSQQASVLDPAPEKWATHWAAMSFIQQRFPQALPRHPP